MSGLNATWIRRGSPWITGAALALLGPGTQASEFYELKIIAESGQAASSDWRIIQAGLGINNAGLVTWNAQRFVNGSDEGGLFVGDGASAPTLITLGQSTFAAANSSINNAGQGQVAFTFSESVDGVSTSRVRVWDRATGTFSDLYTCNQQPTPLPCNSNTFSDNGRVPVIRNLNPQVWQIVAAGPQTTLGASPPSGTTSDALLAFAIARGGMNAAVQGRTSGSTIAIIGALDSAIAGQLGLFTLGPVGNWSVQGVSPNNLGNIAFLSETVPGTALIGMVGVVNPRSGSSSIVRVADTTDGTFLNFGAGSVGGPAMNNLNEVGFAARASYSTSTAAFVGDVSGRSPTPVAVSGEAIPNSNGATFGSVMQGGVYPQAMNDRGQFAFYAFIQRGSTNYNAVLRADPIPGLSPGNPIMPAAGTPLPRGWRFIVRCGQGLLCTGSGGVGGVPRRAAPRVFIDPALAVGYTYEVEAPGPNFASVYVPAALPNGDGAFQVEFNGQTAPLIAGEVFDFTTVVPGGVSTFRITGIDTSEALDPTNAAAFVTGITFVSETTTDIGLTMVPIVVDPDDLDLDGVSNGADLCPNTAPGAVVDSNGCSADQRDSDGDGVVDSLDQCPATPIGSPVNTNGCAAIQLDADLDGVPNTADACPNTAPGVAVDALGCSVAQRDTDGDGVNDSLDQCPGTPAGAAVNSAGCATSQLDSDGDGVRDNVDLCPATPASTPVDANGCPVTPPPAGKTCDVTGDGFIDYRDIRLIILDIGKPASGPNDPRDASRNGRIDLADAAICAKKCDRNFCLPPK